VTNYDQVNGKTCTVLNSPAITATTFSCTLSSAATKNVTVVSGDNATAALGLTTLAVTTSSTHPYVSGNVATLAVPSTVTNYDQLNGKTCTVLNSPTITSTTFSCTLAVAATKNVTVVSGDAATATVGQTTMAITTSAAHGFTSTNVVTLAVPSTVTNYDQLNGKTCTVLASPTITSTTFSCTLSSAATKNVTLTASDAATAAVPLTTLAVTTGVNHNFVATNVIGLTVPNTVTNYDQLNGKTCTVLASPAPTPTTFSCTLSTGAAKNVTLTASDAATADFAQTLVTVTAPGHNYLTGNSPTIATGTPTIDGAKAVTVVDANTFTYTITSYSGVNIDATGTSTLPRTTVTVTAASHGFTNGDKVTIATGNATLDGAKTIAGVSTNSFTYTISSYNGGNLGPGGTATKWITLVTVSATAHGFAASQAVTLSGTGVTVFDNQTCTLPAATPAANTFTCNLATSTDTAASVSAGYASIPGTTVTVVSPNSLTVNDTINVTGAGTPFNVTGATVVSASSTQFTYTVASTAYTQATAGSWLKPITRATLTTTAAHNLVVGDHITISGSGSPFDGDFTITTVPSTTTLTFDLASAASAAASSSTGTVNGASLYVSAGN
ncbi:MAG: hypothetical protein NTZ03_04610, partial [Actinobacteria bacterium]|nr:hypothetical protein [Actinomycetota bacterium]